MVRNLPGHEGHRAVAVERNPLGRGRSLAPPLDRDGEGSGRSRRGAEQHQREGKAPRLRAGQGRHRLLGAAVEAGAAHAEHHLVERARGQLAARLQHQRGPVGVARQDQQHGGGDPAASHRSRCQVSTLPRVSPPRRWGTISAAAVPAARPPTATQNQPR